MKWITRALEPLSDGGGWCPSSFGNIPDKGGRIVKREAKPLSHNCFPFMQRIHLTILGKGIKGIGLLKIKGEGLVNNLSKMLNSFSRSYL